MRLICLLLLGLAAVSPAAASSPIAEVVCDRTDALEKRLTSRMQSTREAMGLQGPGQVMEVWTDRDGDWTLVARYAGGTSCILAMGEAWEAALRQDPA